MLIGTLFILAVFIAHWYLSLFAQSFFHHRYAAHQAFTMNPFWEKMFFIYSWITQGASYLSPRTYAIMHRIHHAYTDTEKDPHSPAFDDNLFKMMWRTKEYYQDIAYERMEVEARFMKNLPEWEAFDRFARSWPSRLMWLGVYVAFYVAFAPSLWFLFMVPFHAVIGPLHGVVINWFAHKVGYENFKMKNTSKNVLKIDWLMLGEIYHNNHHKFPGRINFGIKWHEFDPIYPVILLFSKLGIVKLRPAALSKVSSEF